MSFVHRGFLYVFRKWQQSLITFLILFTVGTAALVGLAILDASAVAAANLRGQLGGTFLLEIDMSNPANMKSGIVGDGYTASYYAGDTIDNNVIDEVLKTPGIADYSAHVEHAANLKADDGRYCNLVENKQNYYSSANAHRAWIQGWTSLEQCSYFANGMLKVTEGEMFSQSASGQAVISRELAEKNRLGIGDRLTLETNREVVGFDIPSAYQECTFEIVGIFDILGEQQISYFTGQTQMLQNWVFVDMRTLVPYIDEMMISLGEKPIGYSDVTFSVNDPAQIESIIRELKQNSAINWDCFKIEVDDENYQNVKNVLDGMDSSVRMMIFAVVLSGIAVLVLLLAIWARFRVRETGVMLALGQGRRGILAQRMIEMTLIAALAFGCSYGASGLAADRVGNMLLAQANENKVPESPSNSIRPGMEITSDDINLNPVFAAPEVEELNITISAGMYVKVYTMGLLISVLCVCAASSPVMKMKPREILSNMS